MLNLGMPFETTTRVRYAETDQMGVVYHSNYIIYFEIGRTEAMRSLGSAYAELEKRGLVLAITEIGAKYHASARYDDVLTIHTWLRELSKARLRFEYEISREGTRLVSGFTVLAFLDRGAGMKPVRCPEDVEQMMLPTVEPK
jgi:acyl-CoA thioester hydrolase